MTRLLLLGLALCHGLAFAQFRPDLDKEEERRNWKEREVRLPAYPKAENLAEFYVSASTDFRFFVDRQSISVGEDGVVRYTLVARSPSGVDNVSYEGIRCSGATYRVYALGRSGAAWSERESEWRPIQQKVVQRQHYALWREYFCPGGAPMFSAAEGIDALARGGHPRAGGVIGTGR